MPRRVPFGTSSPACTGTATRDDRALGIGWRDRLTVLGQRLQVAGNGLPRAFQRLRRGCAVGEATGQRGYRHVPGARIRLRFQHHAIRPQRPSNCHRAHHSRAVSASARARIRAPQRRRARRCRRLFLRAGKGRPWVFLFHIASGRPPRRPLLGCGLKRHLRLPAVPQRQARQGGEEAGAGATAQAARFDDAHRSASRHAAGSNGGDGRVAGRRWGLYAKCWPPLTSMASPVR